MAEKRVRKGKVIQRDTVSDRRRLNSDQARYVGSIKTKTAPPARGQESLVQYMSEDKYLIRKPKKPRRSTGLYD